MFVKRAILVTLLFLVAIAPSLAQDVPRSPG